MHANYRANKLLLDPNAGFGRNVTAEKLQSAEQRADQGEKTFEDDDGGWCGAIAEERFMVSFRETYCKELPLAEWLVWLSEHLDVH